MYLLRFVIQAIGEMKKIYSLFAVLSLFIIVSCHTNLDKNVGQAEVKTADSAGRADSIAAADKTATEREAFRRDLQRRIDSMQIRMNVLDSIYVSNKEKGRENWIASRERIRGRMNRLNERKTEINTVTKDKWNNFKQNVDTAMQNLKNDWNATLDKMKIKPK